MVLCAAAALVPLYFIKQGSADSRVLMLMVSFGAWRDNFGFGTLLRNAGRYNDSNAILRQGVGQSADPMFCILMGRNCEDMQEYGMADSLYTHAFLMVPNCIYPLYR